MLSCDLIEEDHMLSCDIRGPRGYHMTLLLVVDTWLSCNTAETYMAIT